MFTSTGYVIVPSKKQSQCPSTVEWIHGSNSHNKLLHNNDKARTTEICSNINETEHDTETERKMLRCRHRSLHFYFIKFKTTQNQPRL